MDIQFKYYDYSFFEYTFGGTKLFVDPAFSRYSSGEWDQDRTALSCDLVAVTSGDFDHYLDAIDVLDRGSAQLIGGKAVCRALTRKLDLPESRVIDLEDGEGVSHPNVRIQAFEVEPDRLRKMWAEFARRPFDLPRLMPTYYSAQPNSPGRAYLIEAGKERIMHLASALHEDTCWDDIEALPSVRGGTLVIGCNRDNQDEIIRTIRLLAPKQVLLYLAREGIYRRLNLEREALRDFVSTVRADVASTIDVVGLDPGTSGPIINDAGDAPKEWSPRQQMLTLSFIAYVGMTTVRKDPQRLRQLFDQFLASLAPVANQWQFVWGPAVVPGRFADDHVVFIVQNVKRPWELAIVIRGTNPLALENIIQEVNGYSSLVPWSVGGTSEKGLKPMIAEGVQHGLSELLAATPAAGLPGEGTTIMQFCAQVEKAHKPTVIVTTGHSLGGTLASTLALLIQDALDHAPIAKAINMQLSAKTKIASIPFAGFTPGNQDFATYSDARLKACDRVHNAIDSVPHMYAAEDLVKVPTLYAPHIGRSMLMSIGVRSTLRTLQKANITYVQVEQKAQALPGTVSTTTKDFVVEMLWQHTEGYLEMLGLQHYVDLKALLEAK